MNTHRSNQLRAGRSNALVLAVVALVVAGMLAVLVASAVLDVVAALEGVGR